MAKTNPWNGITNLTTIPSTRGIKTESWSSLGRKNTWQKDRAQKQVRNMKKKGRPLGSYYIFPSTDPYSTKVRQELRAVNEGVSWINKIVRVMVAVTTGWGYTISVEPRAEDEQMEDEVLDQWKQTQRFDLPGLENIDNLIQLDDDKWSGGMSGLELEKWMMNYSVSLDLQSHNSRAYRYALEQGNCGVAMLPEYKTNDDGEQDDENGMYELPQVLRTIRPEHNVKIWLDTETGELSSLQIIALLSNGGKLPAERLVWIMTEMNLELNTDYYGESRILPLLDAAKVQAILYGKDFPEAAQYTWHQPKIFQVEIPSRDYKKVTTVLREFLKANNNSAGRDIAVTQNVTPISQTTNTGDITGLLQMDDHLIDQETGFFNMPPFLVSKGKSGNLGGNAQTEEIDAFLNVEVKPQQEILENFWEKQFFDRILKIIFQMDNIDDIPIKIKMNMIKPEISTLFNKDQYEIMLDMVAKNYISEDKMMDKLHLTDAQKDITISSGGDDNPAKNTWPRYRRLRNSKRKNPHWHSSELWKGGNGSNLIKSKSATTLWNSSSKDKKETWEVIRSSIGIRQPTVTLPEQQ